MKLDTNIQNMTVSGHYRTRYRGQRSKVMLRFDCVGSRLPWSRLHFLFIFYVFIFIFIYITSELFRKPMCATLNFIHAVYRNFKRPETVREEMNGIKVGPSCESFSQNKQRPLELR